MPAGLPVVVIGAGPIGLAAAAHAAERGMPFVVLEAGPDAGAAVGDWAHVRLFSAWRELIDPAARRLLDAAGRWTAPDEDGYPTGGQWRETYLQPLADLLDDTAGGTVRYGARVVGVSRAGRDLLVDSGRDADPFAVHVQTPTGHERLLASAVVDASGTWTQPNPLGADGYPALGERENAARITYGIPDFADPAVAARYAGKHVAVAGKGASAQGVLIGLAGLAGTRRRRSADPGVLAAAPAQRRRRVRRRRQRPARGARQARPAGEGRRQQRPGHQRHPVPHRVRHHPGRRPPDHRRRSTASGSTDVDEVIVVTGFRPDFTFLSEVRLDLDPALGAVRELADQVHPDHHSCGDVQPHGYKELAQPEQNLYLVGMKSYGRAPSFLAMTGYEQVRSVVAALDGDLEAAAQVELVLPETGVCNGAGAFDDPDAVSPAPDAAEHLLPSTASDVARPETRPSGLDHRHLLSDH